MSDESASTPPAEQDNHQPTAPKPTTLLAALIIAGVLVFNMYLDSRPGDYDGSKFTYALVFGLLFVLGADLSRLWPGGRDK